MSLCKTFLIFLFTSLLLTACATRSDDPLEPIQYTQSVNAHTNKNAVLVLKSNPPTYSAPITLGGGFLGAVAADVIQSSDPKHFQLAYAENAESGFMSSLRNALVTHHVFNNVEITKGSAAATNNTAVVTVFFKSTQVSAASMNFTLDMDLTIQGAGKPTLQKSFVVTSDTNLLATFGSQRKAVSEKLLKIVMENIQAWNN